MQCNQCHFENMPGLTRCFKCGSVLVVSEPIDINPPRMKSWKKPFRSFNRIFRSSGITLRIPRFGWVKYFADDAFLSIVLSTIPGLGHLLYGRIRKVIWLILIWLLLVAGSIFMYGSNAAMLFFGLAVGLHACIAISCSYLDQQEDILRRIGMVLIVFIAFGTLYYVVSARVFADFTGQFCAMNLDAYEIKTGDFLLARRSWADPNKLSRGDLVLARAEFINDNRGLFAPRQATVVGQIIGIPKDTVEVKKGVYFLNGSPLDPNTFPVPQWLQNADTSVSIPAENYFLNMEYSVNTRNNLAISNYIQQACVISEKRITGKVFMRWLPLKTRGFIKETK